MPPRKRRSQRKQVLDDTLAGSPVRPDDTTLPALAGRKKCRRARQSPVPSIDNELLTSAAAVVTPAPSPSHNTQAMEELPDATDSHLDDILDDPDGVDLLLDAMVVDPSGNLSFSEDQRVRMSSWRLAVETVRAAKVRNRHSKWHEL